MIIYLLVGGAFSVRRWWREERGEGEKGKPISILAKKRS
jgi:hypothetical protein